MNERCELTDEDIQEIEDLEINEREELVSLLGYHLHKATEDPFEYVLITKAGLVIYFTEASYTPGSPWITLDVVRPEDRYASSNPNEICRKFNHRFYRGIQVRLDDIAMVADAPDGS